VPRGPLSGASLDRAEVGATATGTGGFGFAQNDPLSGVRAERTNREPS
jgi:hypothetical protein